MATKTEKMILVPKDETPALLGNSRYADAGSGFENIDPNKDLQMPFLQIIQGLSPELKRENSKYIKGAEQGDIFNSVTRQLYKVGEPDGKPIKIIPCGFIRVYNEWVLRDEGGGFVKSYLEGSQPKTHKGQGDLERFNLLDSDPKHNLVETCMHSVLVLDDEGLSYPAILSMSASLLGVSRSWISKMYARKVCDASGKKFTPPSYDNLCALSTVPKKFLKGEAYIFRVDITGSVDDAVYSEAKDLNQTSKDRLALMAPQAPVEEDSSSNQTSY